MKTTRRCVIQLFTDTHTRLKQSRIARLKLRRMSAADLRLKVKARAVVATVRRTVAHTATAPRRRRKSRRTRSPDCLSVSKRPRLTTACKRKWVRSEIVLSKSYPAPLITSCCPRSSTKSRNCSALISQTNRRRDNRRRAHRQRRPELTRQERTHRPPAHPHLPRPARVAHPMRRARIAATALNHPNVMPEEVATIPSLILIANEE